MIQETNKQKANPDYTASAVNLTNPDEVKVMLDELAIHNKGLVTMRGELEATREFKAVSEQLSLIANIEDSLKKTIDICGSFQDIGAGLYGIKQRRDSINYIPALFREIIPEYAGAVIEEAVNKTKVGGLIKGGLITTEQAERCSQTTTSYSFIIKAGG